MNPAPIRSGAGQDSRTMHSVTACLQELLGESMNRSVGVQTSGGSIAQGHGLAGRLLRTAGLVLAGSALVAICAHIALPLWFTPVPVTLQPFAVLLLGLLLGPRMAAGTMFAYLAEGAIGLPVFAPNGPGGTLQLFGLTGGYLLSYPLVAPLVST